MRKDCCCELNTHKTQNKNELVVILQKQDSPNMVVLSRSKPECQPLEELVRGFSSLLALHCVWKQLDLVFFVQERQASGECRHVWACSVSMRARNVVGTEQGQDFRCSGECESHKQSHCSCKYVYNMPLADANTRPEVGFSGYCGLQSQFCLVQNRCELAAYF